LAVEQDLPTVAGRHHRAAWLAAAPKYRPRATPPRRWRRPCAPAAQLTEQPPPHDGSPRRRAAHLRHRCV
jgi:hypothetical protein